MKNLNSIKIKIWAAQNEVYRVQTLRGNVPVEEILGTTRTIHIERLMDKLNTAGEIY